MNRERGKNLIDTIPALLFALVLLLLERQTPRVFASLLLAGFLSLLLSPLVFWLKRKTSMSETACIVWVYVGAALILVSMLGLLTPLLVLNIGGILEHADTVRERLGLLLGKWAERFDLDAFFETLERRLAFFEARLGAVCLKAVGVAAVLTAAFVLSFYMVRDRERLSRMFLGLFPASRREALISAGKRAYTVWNRFVSGQFLIAGLIGLLETTGLIFLGVPYPYLFGMIGGISNLIPYVGPFLGALPAVVTVLLEGGSLVRVIGTALLFVGAQQLDNWLLTPRIMQGSLGLHPAATILSVLIGAELFGFLGAALAVPVAGILWAIRP